MNENLSDINESNESVKMTADTLPATKTQRLGRYMLETLKEMYQSIRYPKFKFAISGVIITIVLILVSIWFLIHRGVNPGADQIIDLSKMNLIGILISLIVAIFVIYLWFLLGLKVTPKAAHYLVDNKVLKLVFTRGNVHYLEFVPVEKRKIALPHILNKYIALLIAWVSVSAFLLNVIAGPIAEGDPTGILNPTGDFAILAFLLRSIIIFVLVPLVFTLVYPLGWMLVDAKLKAYNSATKLNWLVGTKVSNLTGGLITLVSLFALGADAIFASKIIPRAQLMFELVFFCIINVSLIVVLISLFYNVFFHGKFHQMITESIEVGFGVTSVTLTDEFGNALPEPEPEPALKYEEPEPEPKTELEPEPELEPELERTFEPEEE